MKIKQLILGFYAFLFIGFGLAALSLPIPMSAMLKIQLQAPVAHIEFMATYSGLFIGLGFFMLFCLKNNHEIGLISVLFTMGTMLISRVSGVFIYGGADMIQGIYLVGELFTLILIGSLFYQSGRT